MHHLSLPPFNLKVKNCAGSGYHQINLFIAGFSLEWGLKIKISELANTTTGEIVKMMRARK